MRRHALPLPMGIAAFALLCGAGLALYSPFAPLQWGEAALRGALGMVLGAVLAKDALAQVTPRKLWYSLILALPLSASGVVGAQLQVYGMLRLSAAALLPNLLCWLGGSVFVGLCLLFCLNHGGRLFKAQWLRLNGPPKPWFFWVCFGVLLLGWLPVWLAYFPGITSYDSASHIGQCVTNQYSTLHPLAYTLLMKLCFEAAGALQGGSTLAIALLCWIQMLLMAFAMARGLVQLRKWGGALFPALLTLLFFALFPVFPILAISTTKDVPYAAFAFLAMVEILGLFQNSLGSPQPCKKQVPLVLWLCLMGLFRYNGLLTIALFALILGIACLYQRLPCFRGARKLPRRILLLFFLALGLSYGINEGLNAATSAAPSFVTRRDMASLPSQQLVRAALEMDPKSEEYQEVAQWYSGEKMLALHRPYLADYSKMFINVDHGTGWRGFMETWLSVGLRHPKAYFEAFLDLNRGLWFIHDLSHTNIYQANSPKVGYLLTDQKDYHDYDDPITFHSVLPALQRFLDEWVAGGNRFLALPFLRMLFSIGFQCWVSVFLFWAACYRRDCALMAAMGWTLCGLVLLAVAPAVLVRYALPVFLGNGIGFVALWRKPQALSH